MLRTVMIFHAHPDHFMGPDMITERFPQAQVVSTQNVVTDIETDGSVDVLGAAASWARRDRHSDLS